MDRILRGYFGLPEPGLWGPGIEDKKITLDEGYLDLESCHYKRMVAYWGFLERNYMISFHEKRPKKVHDVRPVSLQQLIKTQVDHDRKPLRNSVLLYFDFLQETLWKHRELGRAKTRQGTGQGTISPGPPRKSN
jgi:hypothetical protein